MKPLATQVFVMILFALSLDLLVGYAGIVTLGDAGLFGMGAYTAGILSVHGITDPIVTALCGMMLAAVTGLAFGLAMLRTKGLTLADADNGIGVSALRNRQQGNRSDWRRGRPAGCFVHAAARSVRVRLPRQDRVLL